VRQLRWGYRPPAKPLPAEWTGHEDGIWVVEARFIAGNNGGHSRHALLSNVSLHAIARWFQRSGHSSDVDLMRAMNLVANINLAKVGEGGGGVKVITDTEGGNWRGRLATVDDGVSTQRLIVVRTWLPD
jgi:hypothetical protein